MTTPRRRTAARLLPAAVMLVVGLCQMPLAVVGADLRYTPGDLVDNRLNNYVLEHGYRWVTGRERSFWSAPFCWPTPRMTARSDAHLGDLPFYAAFRLAGAEPERAFQACVVAFFVLNFASAYWAFRRVGLCPTGAAAGAYVFAFGIPVGENLWHFQLLPRFLVPPAAALAWAAAWAPTWRRVGGCAACVVGQMYLTVYVGLMLAGMLAAGAVVLVALNRGRLPWRALVWPGRREMLARAAVLCAVAAAAVPLVRPHLAMSRDAEPVPRETLVRFIPDPGAWVRPSEVAVAWGWLLVANDRADDTFRHGKMLFPGLIPCLGVVVGFVVVVAGRGRSPGLSGLAGVAAVVVALAAVVVVRGEHWSPYERLMSLPLVGSLRGVGRVILVLLLPLGLLTGWLVHVAVGRAARHGVAPAAAAVVVALLVVLADQRVRGPDDPAWDKRRFAVAEARDRRLRLSETIRDEVERADRTGPEPVVVYLFPRSRDGWDLPTQLDAMCAAQDAGVPTMNGWTGYPPRGWYPFQNFTEIEVWLRGRGLRSDVLGRRLVVLGRAYGRDSEALEIEVRSRVGRRADVPGW